MDQSLPFSEACERNKKPIFEVLRKLLPARGHLLEIGSGTGQHAVFIAPHFPRLSWQTTEQPEFIAGLSARIRAEGASNVLPPLVLDVNGPWPDHHYDAVFSSNTAHIMGWDEVGRMFSAVGERLRPGAIFCLYGPFNVGGCFTSQSNEEFDHQLREQSPEMGLRDIESLDSLGRSHHLVLEDQVLLPANNRILVFRRSE
jgi:cyclopropane fatty-acyl-phospholipid synthase-like methyltransferase